MTQETFTREEILEALTLEPCHITGMHDSAHTIKHICRDQEHEALTRLLGLLGVTKEELPRRLGEDCGWCQRDSEERPLLEAWVNRVPLEFELRWLLWRFPTPTQKEGGFDETPHPELFATYREAWEYACRHREERKFDIHLRLPGEATWRRVGYWR